MPTFDEAVARLTGAEFAGFDVSAATAAVALNEGLRRLASRSKYLKAVVNLGPTVADQAEYVLPTNIVDLESLSIGDAPYTRTSVKKLWDVSYGSRSVIGDGGVFAPTFSADGGTASVLIYPTPDTAGLDIPAFASITPDTLSGTDPIPFPEEHWRAALDAAKSWLYEEIDENAEMATYFSQKFDTNSEELRRIGNSRVGSGPHQITVAGA